MGVSRSLNPNPELARAHSISIYRTHGFLTGDGSITTRQLLSAPSCERTNVFGDDGVLVSALLLATH